ncbi:hypothetical protein [Pseudomonas sp. P97.38]|uniref:hypothetical protein n=1 Tax=Pseudomonas sp. P97.38 TaxID=255451 RepID=UPI0012EE662D|nr:hypothetical protein [Pseudomonas sp. P97.38]
MKKILLCVLLILKACSSHNAPPVPLPQPVDFVKVDYDPATMARVRIYTGSPSLEASYSTGYSCEELSKELPVKPLNRPGPKARLQRVQHYSKLSIGMPSSWRLSEGTALNEKYSEMVVLAGKPFVVDIKNIGGVLCMPPALTFIPEPGVDYEAYFLAIVEGGKFKGCRTVAHKVSLLPPSQIPPMRLGACIQPDNSVKSSITRWDSK